MLNICKKTYVRSAADVYSSSNPEDLDLLS